SPAEPTAAGQPVSSSGASKGAVSPSKLSTAGRSPHVRGPRRHPTHAGGASGTGRTTVATSSTSPPAIGTSSPSPSEANATHLFRPAEDRIGITPHEIRLCMVAPLFLLPALKAEKGDLTFYWDWLNHHGGVDGRKVRMFLADDHLQAGQAAAAMNSCASHDPFAV